MYSGHLFQMIATNQMLYGSRDFDTPGSIRFVYDPVARGLGQQTFDYDIHSLARALLGQFKGNQWLGIECEPNAMFPECNQHPLIGLALYDRMYGTGHFAETSTKFLARFMEEGYPGANSSYMSFLMLRQHGFVRLDDAWGDGWTGTFLHAWQPQIAEQAYQGQVKRFTRQLGDGTATIAMPHRRHGYSHGHGSMAAAAAEVGDADTARAMLAYADKHWSPRWDGDCLSYPRCDAYQNAGDGLGVWRRVQPLTANGLIALARLGGRGRLFQLIHSAFGDAHFSAPCLDQIDETAVAVRYAVHDPDCQRLAFDLRPVSAAGSKPVRFRISNLDRDRDFLLTANGVPVARCPARGAIWTSPGTRMTRTSHGFSLVTPLKGGIRCEAMV